MQLGAIGPGIAPNESKSPSGNTYLITGVTRDTNGAALGACVVSAFETATGLLRAQVISDANGNFSVEVTGGLQFYLVAYKAGSPDVEGTTVNTLTGVG